MSEQCTTIEYVKNIEAELFAANGKITTLRNQVAELQRQQEEAAKEEPVGIVDEGDDGLFADFTTSEGVMVKLGDKLYRLPPNTLAMIEQAVKEYKEDAERYRWLRANAVNGTMEFKRDGYLNCDEPENEWDSTIDAIRARGGK